MKTLTELSEDIHISKGPLSKRMDKIPHFRQKYCIRKNNQLVISDKGLKLISYPKHNSTSNNFHTRRGKHDKSRITSEKKSMIITQLLRYNKTIEKQNKYLKHLTKLLKAKNKEKPKITTESLIRRAREYNSRSGLYRFFHKFKK